MNRPVDAEQIPPTVGLAVDEDAERVAPPPALKIVTDEGDTQAARRAEAPELGDMLRAVYQQAVEEPVPDDLLGLLDQLK